MGVGGTGKSRGRCGMWRREEREPDVADMSYLSDLGVENAHCLTRPPTLPSQAAGWISKVTSQIESSQILSFFFFFLISCVHWGGAAL